MSGAKSEPAMVGERADGRDRGDAGPSGIRLRLPATSANLGPGFDAVAVALDFALEIEAEAAAEFSIAASGRDAERCGQVDGNLIVETYAELMQRNERAVVPLAMLVENGIPLGMGCGSSAAARLAAIALAAHFGRLNWDSDRVLEEAYALEGHPDNVAACWLGGFVTATCEGKRVRVAKADPPEEWRAIVVLPAEPLATSEARAMLPSCYSLEDVVKNLQSVALLGLAFAQGRGDLLRLAMRDRIHQPYREGSCPLLVPLTPLVGANGILGVALSGAGPAVLAIADHQRNIAVASRAILSAIENRLKAELVVSRFSRTGASQLIERKRG